MSRHVEGVRHQMFNDSTNAVKKSLKKLIKDIEDFLLGKADEVFLSVKRDYESVVLGRLPASNQLPREQRQIRTDVNNIVESTEMILKKVVGLEPETPEPSVADAEEKTTSVESELLGPHLAMDDIEPSEPANDAFSIEASGISKADDEANVSVERNAAEPHIVESLSPSEGDTTWSSPTHQVESETMKAVSLLVDSEVADDQARSQAEKGKQLTEASNVLNTPAIHEKKRGPLCDSGQENELMKSQSMSVKDLDQALNSEATESGHRYERSSSVASWVQSWFTPRE